MSADKYDGPAPEGLPESHPLAGYNGTLDDHADHLDALAEFLGDADPEEIRSLMLVVTTDEGSDTIPTMREDAEFEDCVWFQLAAHISHVAHAFEAPTEEVASHAVHVLRRVRGEMA